jgi:hypothetical protein
MVFGDVESFRDLDGSAWRKRAQTVTPEPNHLSGNVQRSSRFHVAESEFLQCGVEDFMRQIRIHAATEQRIVVDFKPCDLTRPMTNTTKCCLTG